MNSFIAVPGGWELVLIVLVILLLFGAKKLPELARGSGRALRIFKSETKGLIDDDDDGVDDDLKTPEQKQLEAGQQHLPPAARRPVTPWCASSATAPPADPIRRCPSPESSVSSRGSPTTRSARTAAWRCPTTCGSCAAAS